MVISRACGMFFTLFLLSASLSVEAVEAVASLTDVPTVRIADTRTMTSSTPDVAADAERPSAGGRHMLDIAFVVSNALLGYVLLRRANKV